MTKITVAEITVTRAEGPSTETRRPKTFRGEKAFQEADLQLKAWAVTAPEDGSSDQVDFRITWTDGDTYEGCYLLKRTARDHTNLLGGHVAGNLRYLAGLQRLARFKNEAEYQLFVEQRPDLKRLALRMLDRYQIGY